MKTVITFVSIIYLFNINNYSQINRSGVFTGENESNIHFSKPIFMDPNELDSLINEAMNLYFRIIL